jgi:hypothetical protein
MKDNRPRTLIKVELIETSGLWSERRAQIRVNGQEAERIKAATLTEVFDPLRRWQPVGSGK